MCPWLVTFGRCTHPRDHDRYVHEARPRMYQEPLECCWWKRGHCSRSCVACPFAHYDTLHGIESRAKRPGRDGGDEDDGFRAPNPSR